MKLLFGAIAYAVLAAPTFGQGADCVHHAAPLGYEESILPPWQHGSNNDVASRGLEFTAPEVDVLADFHGSPTDPRLVLFVGGNYFFAMAPLVHAFESTHPEYNGAVYWETLPPGLLVKQMEAGGTITVGNMTWTVRPDAYLAGLMRVNSLIKQGLLVGEAVPYVTNKLTIMVPSGNPNHIGSLSDLGKPGIRLAMPNPEFEGVARQIKIALAKAGGAALVNQIYERKVGDGSTILTRIHHRQTPLFLMKGLVDAGITWQSEALFQEQVGHKIDHVAIPDRDNATAIYAGAIVDGAAHPQAAKAWLDFIQSPDALKIFEHYGFEPVTAASTPGK